VVLLPGADESDACAIAERLRKQVSAITLPAVDALVTVTVSIGVAELGTHGSELFELLAVRCAPPIPLILKACPSLFIRCMPCGWCAATSSFSTT
jgi:hypothetical protein